MDSAQTTEKNDEIGELGTTPETVLASRWSRFWAWLIDSLITIIFIVPVYTYLLPENLENVNGSPLLLLLIFAYSGAIYLLWHGYLLHKYGQSIGKNVFEIAIVTMENQRVGLPKLILKRWLPLAIISFLGPIGSLLIIINILFIFRKDRRCIHDLIAGTQVVSVAKKKELVLTD